MDSIMVKCSSCGATNKIPARKQHLHARCGRCHAPLDLSGAAVPVELGDADFQAFVAQAPLPVLVDFFSPTCGPCQMVAPAIDRLAKRFIHRFIVAKLDTGRNPLTPSRFQIRGVPTLLFFNNGHVVDQLVGAANEEAIAGKMAALLAA